jgi:hypothetical protein
MFGFALGKAYRQLPRHNGNFEQLASNVEWLANRLLDEAVRTNYGLNAPSRWEWRLGHDLMDLVNAARDARLELSPGDRPYLRGYVPRP